MKGGEISNPTLVYKGANDNDHELNNNNKVPAASNSNTIVSSYYLGMNRILFFPPADNKNGVKASWVHQLLNINQRAMTAR